MSSPNGPAAPAFIVGAYTFTASGSGLPDTNTVWVNPSGLGGPTPPTSPIHNNVMTVFNMSDIGGLCLEDRPGNGATGGVPTNWIANLIIGTNWSFVTGGPEFTSQPVSTVVSPSGTTSLSGTAVAAGQSVNYQWQKIVSGSPVNVNPGSGGAGGAATVSGQNASTLTLTGASSGDGGTYQLLATAAGTGFTLASAQPTITVSDPAMAAQPQNTTANYGQSATFTAQIYTATSSLKWAWYDGSTMLVAPNGSPTGNGHSTVTGAQGTNTANVPGTVTVSMTLSNVSCADDGSYHIQATNASGSTVTSTPASLTVNDPYIVTQPPATAEVSSITSAVIPVVAQGTGITYQWQWNNLNGANANNNGEITGATTSALTISAASATPNDAGTYSVVVGGTACAGSVPSTSTIVYYDTAVSTVAVSPSTLTQPTNTHLALVGTINGGSGLVTFVWRLNGTTLTNGVQADGTTVSGANVVTNAGAAVSALVLSNLHVGDSGTYTLVGSNAAGVSASAYSVLTVTANPTPFATSNLVVLRVGEGSEALSGATGNTVYLDQFQTNGNYISSIMVPDSGGSTLIVPGGPPTSGTADHMNEAYMTLSSNGDYLNFAGYFQNYPYTLGPTVTFGGTANPRSIGAVNGLGYYVLAYTNQGLYNGGQAFIRDAYSTDGLTNFWTTGAAGSSAIKYVNAGPAGATYATGNGIPALAFASVSNGPCCLGLAGTNLIFSDFNSVDANKYSGTGQFSSGDAALGLDVFGGAPETANTDVTNIVGIGNAADFAFSPDQLTVYIADSSTIVAGGMGYGGGIQRYDWSGSRYTNAYTLIDTTGVGTGLTNGVRGLTVYFPPSVATWGGGATGAVVCATTSETVSNRLIEFVDTGVSLSPDIAGHGRSQPVLPRRSFWPGHGAGVDRRGSTERQYLYRAV